MIDHSTSIALIAPNSSMITEIRMENLSLGYLASILRMSGYKVEIIDAALHNLAYIDVVKKVSRCKCSIVGISISNACFINETNKIVGALRKSSKNCHICLGGYLPTANPNLLYEIDADSMLYGEADHTFIDLVKKLSQNSDWRATPSLIFMNENKEIVRNEHNGRIANLDDISFPARDTLPYVLSIGGVASMSTSRGCYGKCSFCLINSNFSKQCGKNQWIPRSPKNVVDEIEVLANKFGLNEIWFIDPNFIGTKPVGSERALDICNEMAKRNIRITFSIECRTDDILNNKSIFSEMKHAGLRRVYMGVESATQRTLEIYQKGTTVEQNFQAIRFLEDKSLSVHLGMIFFAPFTTLRELKDTISFIKEIGLSISIPGLGRNTLGLLPGTSITRKMNDINIFPDKYGLGYRILSEEVKYISYIINKLLKYYPVIEKSERISWRDKYIMQDDFAGHILVQKLRYHKNTIIIGIMEDLIEFFDKNTNHEIKDIVNYLYNKLKKYEDMYLVLERIFKRETQYRSFN